MTDIDTLRKSLVTRLLEGPGIATPAERRAALEAETLPEPLDSLLRKVRVGAHEIGDDDVAAAVAAGMSEDAIFELVVCAAVGRATRRHEAALAVLRSCTEGG